MTTEALQVSVNTKGAQADLSALSRALDSAGSAWVRMESKFSSGGEKVDAALTRSLSSAEKAARVAAMLGQVKVSNNASEAILGFAKALDALGRAKSFDGSKISGLREFIKLLPQVKAPQGGAKIAEFMNIISSVKAPSPAAVRNLSEFMKVISKFKAPAFGRSVGEMTSFLHAAANAKAPSATTIRNLAEFMKVMGSYRGTAAGRYVGQMASFLDAAANAKAPSASTINRLREFLAVLSGAKGVSGAKAIAEDLQHIALAANRASMAFGAMPRSLAQLSGVAGSINNVNRATRTAGMGAAGMGVSVKAAGEGARGSREHFQGLSVDLGNLGERFKTGYQLGTLFSAMFSSFTLGQFIKGVYEANIQVAKLQKSMLLMTGTFAGASQASNTYFVMAQKLGVSIDKTIEGYARYAIAAHEAGMAQSDIQKSFEGVQRALQVTGGDAESQTRVMYGLQEMEAKGIVQRKELVRQIGTQIPGSMQAAAAAMSKMVNRTLSMGEALKLVSKGGVSSAEFVPLWIDELNKMSVPLQALADKRPDVQLARLGNAFKFFSLEVGKQGFVSLLGKGFGDMAGKILDVSNGTAKLTPHFQELAERVGRNMADFLKKVQVGLTWIVDHIPIVVKGFELFLGLKVANTMLSWANNAQQAATWMFNLGKNAEGSAAKVEMLARAKHDLAMAKEGDAGASLAEGAAKKGGIASIVSGLRNAGGRAATNTVGDVAAQVAEGDGASATGAIIAARGNVKPGDLGKPSFWSRFGRDASGKVSLGAQTRAALDARAYNTAHPDAEQLLADAPTRASMQAGEFGRRGAPYAWNDQSEFKATAGKSFGLRGAAGAAGEAEKTVKTIDMTVKEATLLEKAGKAAGASMGLLAVGFGKVAAPAASGVKGVAGFLMKLTGLGPVGLGVAAGLAVAGAALYGFSRLTTTVGGKAVRNADVMGAGFHMLGDQIGKWWTTSGKNIGAFGISFDSLQKDSGEITADIVAGFVWMADQIGLALKTIADGIKGLLTGSFHALGDAFDKISHGDFKGAMSAAGADFGKAFKPMMDDADQARGLSFSAIKKGITNYAIDHSTAPGAKTAAQQAAQPAAEDAASQKQVEASLAQNEAAQLIDSAANTFYDAAAGFKEAIKPLDFSRDLAPGLLALADGSFATSKQPRAGDLAGGSTTGMLGTERNASDDADTAPAAKTPAAKAAQPAPSAAAQAAKPKTVTVKIDGDAEVLKALKELHAARSGASKPATAAAVAATPTAAPAAKAAANDTDDSYGTTYAKRVKKADGAVLTGIYDGADKARGMGFEANPELLKQIAARESSFDPNARNATTGALGLFQIEQKTYEGLLRQHPNLAGLSRTNAADSSVLESALIQSDKDVVKRKSGHEVTDQEAYITHFLGAPQAAKLFKAYDTTPEALAKDLLPKEAAVNHNNFFNKNGEALTVRGFYAKSLTGTAVGEGKSVGAQSYGGEDTDENADKADTKRLDNYKSLMTLIGGSNPQAQAYSSYQESLAKIKGIKEVEEEAAAKFGAGFKSIVDKEMFDKIAEEEARQIQKLRDASDPISKINRLNAESQQITMLKNSGMSAEAEYQSHLNSLVEEGYRLKDVDNKASRDAFMLGEQRNHQLAAQAELLSALNGIALKKADRGASPADRALNDMLAEQYKGKSPTDARTAAQADGVLSSYKAIADAQTAADQAANAHKMISETTDSLALDSMGAGQKAYTTNYAEALRQITGMSDASLSELRSAASADAKSVADAVARVKEAIANEDGFRKWADAIEPFAQKLQDIKASFMSGLSDTITNALSGDYTKKGEMKKAFRETLHSAFKESVHSQVENALGGFIKGGTKSPEQQAAMASANLSTAGQSLRTAADFQAKKAQDAYDYLVGVLKPAIGNPLQAQSDQQGAIQSALKDTTTRADAQGNLSGNAAALAANGPQAVSSASGLTTSSAASIGASATDQAAIQTQATAAAAAAITAVTGVPVNPVDLTTGANPDAASASTAATVPTASTHNWAAMAGQPTPTAGAQAAEAPATSKAADQKIDAMDRFTKSVDAFVDAVTLFSKTTHGGGAAGGAGQSMAALADTAATAGASAAASAAVGADNSVRAGVPINAAALGAAATNGAQAATAGGTSAAYTNIENAAAAGAAQGVSASGNDISSPSAASPANAQVRALAAGGAIPADATQIGAGQMAAMGFTAGGLAMGAGSAGGGSMGLGSGTTASAGPLTAMAQVGAQLGAMDQKFGGNAKTAGLISEVAGLGGQYAATHSGIGGSLSQGGAVAGQTGAGSGAGDLAQGAVGGFPAGSAASKATVRQPGAFDANGNPVGFFGALAGGYGAGEQGKGQPIWAQIGDALGYHGLDRTGAQYAPVAKGSSIFDQLGGAGKSLASVPGQMWNGLFGGGAGGSTGMADAAGGLSMPDSLASSFPTAGDLTQPSLPTDLTQPDLSDVAAGLGGGAGSAVSANGGLNLDALAGGAPTSAAGVGKMSLNPTPNPISTLPQAADLTKPGMIDTALTPDLGGIANDNSAPDIKMAQAADQSFSYSHAPKAQNAGTSLKAIGGQMGGMAATGLSILGDFLTKDKDRTTSFGTQKVNGVIGESRAVNVSGQQIAAHSNPIAEALDFGAGQATGNFGAGGGSVAGDMSNIGASLGNDASSIMSLFGFSEGGISGTQGVGQRFSMPTMSFHDVPHYAEGTPNTTGNGIPAVLHPNEAVVPLSRGRSIPVDMGDMQPQTNITVHSPIHVTSPDADSFRQSSSSISRTQNTTLKRTATRNLTAAA